MENMADFKEFSVVLFKGQGIVSNLIRKVTGIEEYRINKNMIFTHCGILLKGATLGFPEEKYVVLELTCSGKLANDPTPDLLTGKTRFGLQVRSFEEIKRNYPGKVYVLQINDKDPGTTRFLKYFREKKAIDFVEMNKKIKYQLNLIKLLATAVPKLRKFRKFSIVKDKWFTCASMAANFYKELEIFPEYINIDDIIPSDFIHDSDGELRDGIFERTPVFVGGKCKK